MFLAALDQTIVVTAGPEIQRALALSPAVYPWLTTAYLVASTALVPVWGKASDLLGRKAVLLAGVAVFIAGSLGCALSPGALVLIAARGVQGAGSAAIFTTAFAVLGDLFSEQERGRYTGLFGSIFGVSSLLGPLLGGLLTDAFGWHAVFLVNLPLGALALAVIAARMPPLRPSQPEPGPVDVAGALLLAVAVVPLLLAASFGRSVPRPGDAGFPWLSWQTFALVGLAAAGLAGLLWWERRARAPLLDLALFRRPAFAWGNAVVFVLGAAFLTPMVFQPLFMVNVVGSTATASGLTISPLVLGIIAGNLASGQLAARTGRTRPFMLGSLLLLAVGFAVMAFTLTAQSGSVEVTAKLLLLGLGLGPAVPLYTVALQAAAPREKLGVATATGTFSRQLGSALGVALVGSVYASTLSVELGARLAEVTRGLPAEVVERFTPPGASAPEAEARQFDAAKVKARIAEQLSGARSVAKKALEGNGLAVALVEANPLSGERLRAAVADGGVAAKTRARLEGLRLRAALAAEEPARWRAFLDEGALPAPLAARLGALSAAELADPERRALSAAFDEATEDAVKAAVAAELAEVDAAIARSTPQLVAAVDAADQAIKESFTLATTNAYRLGLVFALLALALTLPMPETRSPLSPDSAVLQ